MKPALYLISTLPHALPPPLTSSVLHLGNVYFHRKQLRHGQEGVEIGSLAEIKWASHLLQIDAEGIKRALTTKITVRMGMAEG